MTNTRPAVLIGLLMFLVGPAIASTSGGQQEPIQPTTMIYEQPLPAPATTGLRQRLHSDPWSGEHRPFRVSEPSASKAKREQALRNILAARRRQQASFGQRPFELSRSNLAVDTGEEASASKEPGDLLEAQETGHGVYATATVEPYPRSPGGEKTEPGDPTGKPSEQNSTASTILEAGNGSRSNYSIDHRNSSSGWTTTTSSSVQHGPRVTQDVTEARRRSTVPMPESLYNYFRPVESNIPVEDMSQFLYFGQKIQPGDVQPGNSTGNNNSVEATTSRRRYQSKRPAITTTTTTVVPQLEDIVNEEMNIAVERRTVERNKVSKIKNAFRSPEIGLYYGKSRAIASNVIPVDKTGNTTSLAEEADSQRRAGGSATTGHVHAETRNATQIPAVSAYEPASEGTVESEIEPNDANGTAADSIVGVGARTEGGTAEQSVIIEIAPDKTGEQLRSMSGSAKPIDMEMYADRSDRRVTRTGTAAADHPSDRTDSMDQSTGNNTTESNNIETSGTRREKIVSSFFEGSVGTTGGTSTLRIVVTEEGFANEDQPEEKRNTVKPVDSREEQRVPAVASGDVPTPRTVKSMDPPVVTGSRPHRPLQQSQHQQQHVYAYTITNVTRLLRNYTGPGPSGEEQGGEGGGGGGGGGGGTGTAEITTGSAQRPPPPPPRRPPPPPPAQPSSPVLLPRAGSGSSSSSIEEAARTAAELSAGTTVEPATAGGASDDIGGGGGGGRHLVGEQPRKVGAFAVARTTQAAGQRAANRTGLFVRYNPIVNKTGTSLGWDHRAKTRQPDNVHERRFLRKSASAVLNQRIGAQGQDEEDAAPLNQTRRTVSGGVVPGGRAKGPSFEKETMVANNLNESAVANGGGGGGGGGVSRSLTDEAESVVADKPEGEKGPLEGSAPVITSDPSIDSSKTGETVNDRSTTDFSERTIETTTVVGWSVASPGGENASLGAKDGDASESNVAAAVSATDKGADNHGSGSVAVTVTEAAAAAAATAAVNETTPAKETTTTTPGAPVFPVTPRILGEPSGRVTVDSETFTLGPTEPAKLDAVNKSLDPSEIQRMYRSKDRTTTDAPGSSGSTTEAPGSSGPTEEPVTIGQDQRGSTSERPETEEGKRRRPTGERSPEVRARNLSDKSRDKDDVLPIMQLYNTSDIFNGSGSTESPTAETQERPRVELPVETKPLEASSTTTTVETTTIEPSSTTTTRPSTEEKKENGGVFRPSSEEKKENGGVFRPSTEEKEENGGAFRPSSEARPSSEEKENVPSSSQASGPARGLSSFVNGTDGGNGGRSRSRQRPVYYPILPDYNGTSLYPDVNRTLLDMGGPVYGPRDQVNVSEVISRRHDSDAIASQETVAVVSYILATLVVFPIAVGVGLILRRLILRNRKVLEESDTSSEISCRKDGLNLENGDFKTSIEKAITKLPRIQHLCHEAEKPPPPSTPESRWEFPRDKLRLQTVLGQGNFGQVWKAEADDLTGHQGTTRLVAVKTVKEGASEREKEDLVRELEIMQQLGSHPNVVTLLGCCTEQEPHYLILEYVMYGKLLAYLRDHRTRQDFYNFSEDSAALTSRDLTVFGYCVARGMEYLASKKIIHRDLAARNVLVDHNKLCKIADFGMSRFANEDGEVIETRHGRNALPIRWMAPESLIYSLFTTKTDVWSFGILMWEIVTLGSTPYPDMTAREVMRNVQNGYRLERPSHCRSELFRVISRCWQADPDRRPEFQTLRRDLAQLLEDNMNGHYVDLESFASECTD